MKKLLLIGLALIVASGIAAAQDSSELVFEPDSTFTVSDLQFTFLFPETWVYDTSDGIQFAENEEDLAAEIDDDDTTQAAGYEMNLTAVPVAALGLAEGSDLAAMVDTVVELVGLEVYERFAQPVMVYQGEIITGIDPQGEEGMAVFWRQNDYLVFLGLGVPEEVGLTDAVFYTFGYIIGAMAPITDLELTETLEVEDVMGGFTIDYPDGWFSGGAEGTGPYYIVELEDEGAAAVDPDFVPEGVVVLFQRGPLDEIGLESDSTAWDVIDALLESRLYAEFTHVSELWLFDAPAVAGQTVFAPTESEIRMVVGVVGDSLYAFALKAPDVETLEAFWPTLVAMLGTITVAEEE